jgi:eukaryotic-like serine/threonine-protein kinase
MDIRPLLRFLAVVALLVAIVLAFRARRAWPSRRTTGIVAGVLAALAVAGFVFSSLALLEPRAPVPNSLTLYYVRDQANGEALEAASAVTGAVRWQFGSPIADVQWPPTLDNGVLYLGTGNGLNSSGTIRAVRASDGKETWSTPVQGRADQETPAVENGVVYATAAGGVYALRATDGSQLWYMPWSGDNISSAHVANGVVYAVLSSVSTPGEPKSPTTVYALGASDGALLWKHSVVDEVHDAITVADGTVYVRSLRSGVVALDASDGTLLWQRQDLGQGPSPVVTNGMVYVGAYVGSNPNHAMFALDAHDGTDRWHTSLVNGDGYVAIAGDTLYVGGNSAYALRTSDGHVLWRYGSGADFFQPVVIGSVVFVGSSDICSDICPFTPLGIGSNDFLNALDARSGSLYWRTSGAVESAPIVSN